jgi:hypothetical protein
MLKKFISALIAVQAIITALHWLLYKLMLYFLPGLSPYKVALAIVILLFSLGFGSFSSISHYHENRLIRFLYIFFGVWMIFAFYLFLGLAIALPVYLIMGWPRELLGTAALAISAGLIIYGLINARITRTIKISIKLQNLPGFWKNKTAVMASDLHLGHVLKIGFAKKIVRLINSHRPEIVFLPGDFYDGVHTNFQELANEFKHIAAPLGSYYCSGNHEMYAGYQECETALKNAGIKVLEDEKTEVEGMQILGLANKFETGESVSHRLQQMDINPNKPSILLKHIPSHLHVVEKYPVSLQLSGHTHLGQIWPFRYITKKVFKGYDYGFKQFGGLQIFTSSGAGTWGPPLRIFTKSEIVKITFI